MNESDLSYDERKDIQGYIQKGYSTSYIASILARPSSLIKRELKENYGRQYYDAFKANKKACNKKNVLKKTMNSRLLELEKIVLSLVSEVEILKK